MGLFTNDIQSAQKHFAIFVKFVHTFGVVGGIIITVKTPNTLYSFCYTP